MRVAHAGGRAVLVYADGIVDIERASGGTLPDPSITPGHQPVQSRRHAS